MPAKRAQEPDQEAVQDATPAAEPESPPAAEATPADEVPAGRLAAGVYEFTGAVATQYLEVPLTARPATDDGPATVFDWPFSAPDDGRWKPTRRKPNQLPDNAPADDPEGE